VFDTRIHYAGREFHQAVGLVVPYAPATEQFIPHLRSLDYTSVLDVGCGSGLLGISLYRPGVRLTLTDINPQACELARFNCGNIAAEVVPGSWFEPVEGQYDLIISNPPHGTTAEWIAARDWAQQYIPQNAVDGGHDGTECIRAVLDGCRPHKARWLALIHSRFMSDWLQREVRARGMSVYDVKHSDQMTMTLIA
jgi:release factor glutamine methyltransferase